MKIFVFVLFSDIVIKPRSVKRKVWAFTEVIKIQGNFGLKLCRVILNSVLRRWSVFLDVTHLAYREEWWTVMRR